MNRLQHEKSPYLQQHKQNPVDWYPWGSEAFEMAKAQRKPIFLSIGYSTCYWCHVMEKDSFEIEEVGMALNQSFVPIKVDREELPHVDELYMDAVVSMTGRGGWPMSVFLTPDLEPFWAGTFFYKDQFLSILSQIATAWETKNDEILDSAKKLTAYLATKVTPPPNQSFHLDQSEEGFLGVLSKKFDPVWGGFGKPPKFPPAEQLRTMLRIAYRSSDKTALPMVQMTLKAMAWGGIYDHVGGGFSRYSVDERWSVPHFEKMLYDNALLAVVYAEGFEVFGDEYLRDISLEILNYLLRDMRGAHAFFAAEDAGDVGKEGEFYVWNDAELKQLLTEVEYKSVFTHFLVTESGNFEHGNNVLHLRSDVRWEEKSDVILSGALTKLRSFRETHRQRPARDTKILSGWNGLAVMALVAGFRISGDAQYRDAAIACLSFIQSELFDGDQLFRRWSDGEAKFPAALDDYAAVALSCLRVYEITGTTHSLSFGRKLLTLVQSHFADTLGGGYFFSIKTELPVRQKEFFDGATPSGNSLLLEALIGFGELFPLDKFREHAEELGNVISAFAAQHPAACARGMQGLQLLSHLNRVLVLPDHRRDEFYQARRGGFLPFLFVAFAGEEDSQMPAVAFNKNSGEYFLCRDGSCSLPTSNVNDIIKELHEAVP